MKCPAIIIFGDDFGDNSATFHCQKDQVHEGEHCELGDMGTVEEPVVYRLLWKGSSRDQLKEEA